MKTEAQVLAGQAIPTSPVPTGPIPTGPIPTGPIPTGPTEAQRQNLTPTTVLAGSIELRTREHVGWVSRRQL